MERFKFINLSREKEISWPLSYVNFVGLLGNLWLVKNNCTCNHLLLVDPICKFSQNSHVLNSQGFKIWISIEYFLRTNLKCNYRYIISLHLSGFINFFYFLWLVIGNLGPPRPTSTPFLQLIHWFMVSDFFFLSPIPNCMWNRAFYLLRGQDWGAGGKCWSIKLYLSVGIDFNYIPTKPNI